MSAWPWSTMLAALWPKRDGRYLCTSAQPRPADATGQWIHTVVLDDGECYEGCCDRWKCGNCGTRWTANGGHG